MFYVRSEIISLRSERDKFSLEANFARGKLESFMKEFEHQVDILSEIVSTFYPSFFLGVPVRWQYGSNIFFGDKYIYLIRLGKRYCTIVLIAFVKGFEHLVN